MTPSFSEIKQLIENSSRDGIKTGLKISFSLLFLVIVFITIAWTFVHFQVFEIYFIQELFTSLEKIGLSQTFLEITSIFLLAIILYFVLVWLRFWISKDFLVKRNYKWDISRNLKDWQFQGNIVVDNQKKAIHIIQSELGCIVTGRSWKNFEMKFDFFIPDPPIIASRDEKNGQLDRGFGIVYRAEELGKYCMLKVDLNGYRPHVRNILWENNGAISKLSSQKNTYLNKWINAKLSIQDNFLNCKIKNDKFGFLIPTHSSVHQKADYLKESEIAPYAKIPFRDAGSVGFRSAAYEEVFIRNIEVREEPSLIYLKRKMHNLIKYVFS